MHVRWSRRREGTITDSAETPLGEQLGNQAGRVAWDRAMDNLADLETGDLQGEGGDCSY